MRDLQGNPHADRAQTAETTEDGQAIVNAILAVAYELRTANMIDFAAVEKRHNVSFNERVATRIGHKPARAGDDE